MKAISCIAWGIHLSESKNLFTNHTHRRFATTVVAEFLGVLLLWNTECAGASAGSITAAGTPRLPDQVRLNLGTIGIMEEDTPATCRFATGVGVVESRGERVVRYASDTINKSTGTPEGDVMLSPITLVLTPFAILIAEISPNRKMGADDMAAAQLDLAAALERACRQEPFRAEVIRAAREIGGRDLVDINQARGDPSRVDTLLQTRIEQVSLERVGRSEKSFVLKIKTRNTLLRASDGRPIYDRPVEYCSRTDLFIDWTRATAIDSVMKTGIGEITRDIALEMLSLYDAPVVAGTVKPAKSSKTAPPLTPVKLTGLTPQSAPGFIQVSESGSGAIGFYATTNSAQVSLQNLPENQSEMPDSVQKTESMLDGLDKHPNYFVSLPAIVVAVPVSIGNQVVEAFMRVSPGKAREASENLRRAARGNRIDEQVTLEVAKYLAPQTAQPLVIVNGPLPRPGEPTPLDRSPDSARSQFVSKPLGATRMADAAIHIRITSASLTGEGEHNPRLSLCIKGEADIVRLSDGVKLCSFPMEFRSEKHRYTKWAADDADLFRKELKHGYSELGKALADRLVTRGIVPPEGSRSPFLATN